MLGPYKNEGNVILYSIVAYNGHTITRQTFRSIRTLEIHSKTQKRKQRIFDDVILKKLGDSVAKPTESYSREYVTYSDSVDIDFVKIPEENGPVTPGGDTAF